ncbi:MAG TPA: serine hydrolase [Longimicrobiaceae bacterium]|nr:serine hydrolase [Longimicrobiaceae bacterium]
MKSLPFLSGLTLVLLSACVPNQPLPPTPPPPPAVPAPDPGPQRLPTLDSLLPAPPEVVGMHPMLGVTLDSVVEAGLADGAAPGAAVAVGRYSRLVHLRGYGRIDTPPNAPEVTPRTLFDLASLTKVVGTTTAAMILEERGMLDLDRTVASYLPEFNDSTKAEITVRMLLTHSGGLEAFAPLYQDFSGREQYLEQINERPLEYEPGTATIYSDWDFVLMALVIEEITGMPLNWFLEDNVFGPLGMVDTGFRPDLALRPRIAATEVDKERGLIWGEVHDPNAFAIGGVAGHAGLFSTAHDLAIFAQMMLNGGEYGGVRILEPATIARWTARQGPDASRALGWDTPSGRSSSGHYASARSFGHTGYTGTSLWIDPERGLFTILLTNRVNPTAANQRHVQLRRDVADAVQKAILDAPLIDWESAR